MYSLYIAVAGTVATLVSILGLDLIPIIATVEYRPAALAIPLLAFSAIANQSFQTMGPGIEISQKTWHITWITVMTASINVGLNFYFVPRYGFVGAAITTLISFLVYWLTKYAVAQRYFPVRYRLPAILVYYTFALALALIVPVSEIHFG